MCRRRWSRTTSSRRSSRPPTSGSANAPGSASDGSPAREEALTDIALPAAVRRARRRRRRRLGHRPSHLRDRDAGHDVPDVVGDPGGHARDASRGGVRPARGLHRLRLRDRAGLRDARVRSLAARARRRRRRALEDSRLGGPLDARALRRRRRSRRHGAGRARWASSDSSSARTARRRVPVVSRAPARGTSRTPTRS